MRAARFPAPLWALLLAATAAPLARADGPAAVDSDPAATAIDPAPTREASAPTPAAAGIATYGHVRLRHDLLSPIQTDGGGEVGGRSSWGSGFLRAGMQIPLGAALRIDLELEALNGLLWGEGASLGTLADTAPFTLARSTPADLLWVLPRKASLTYRQPAFVVSAGIQSWMWGTGILSHDGTGDPLFGDTRQGNVVARLGGALLPFAQDTAAGSLRGLALFAATDFVLRDDNAQVWRGDLAFSAQGGVRWQGPGAELGALVAARYQIDRPDLHHPFAAQGAHPTVLALPLDVYGRWQTGGKQRPLALRLEGEAVVMGGHTTRSITEEAPEGARIASHGAYASATVSVLPFDLDVALATTYASGDRDPRDGVVEQFTMHSDHNVGFILFDELLPMLSARAADRVADPGLVATPPAGLRHAISQGGVQNALAFHPSLRWQPGRALDLRLGYVLAYAAAPLVDIYETAKNGGYPRSYFGSTGRTYGHELDASVRRAFAIGGAARVELGVEGGIFLPGDALSTMAQGRLSEGPVTSLRGRLDLTF